MHTHARARAHAHARARAHTHTHTHTHTHPRVLAMFTVLVLVPATPGFILFGCIFGVFHRPAIPSLAGAAHATHKVFGNVIAIEFAGTFDPDDGLIATRLEAGPHQPALVEPVASGRGLGSRPPGVRVPAIETQWKDLGKCGGCRNTIQGGEVVEIELDRKKVRCRAIFHACSLQCDHSAAPHPPPLMLHPT